MTRYDTRRTLRKIFDTIPVSLRDYVYFYVGECLENPNAELRLELVANLDREQIECVKALGSLCYIFRKELANDYGS